ncbi:MAG: hypothetical protein JRI23_31365 [Deltaproteobacteria bacterium]|jgi:hypothetical protein|nr:hypothetical protein [Deltaproteobacteria bacterium]MBW2536709.1 hypothetical protein [Deltaproteobacteria bacterium]
MDPLWLLEGNFDTPGWKDLERDAKADKVDWVLFDRDAFAIIAAQEPPEYDGFSVREPGDGLYVDQQGNSVCIVDRELVRRPEQVIEALGPKAKELLDELGDPVAVLQRLGKAF